MTTPQTHTSMPPQESSSTVPAPGTPLGTAHTMLSMLGQASSSRETPSQPSAAATVLDAAETVLSRLVSSAATNPHGTQPSVEVPREHVVEVSLPAEVPQRAAESIPPPTSVSSQGAGGGRATTPPRGVARVTRPYPAPPEAAHHHTRPISIPFGTVYRRSAGPYPDSETAWNAHDERDHLREKSVGERLDPAIEAAKVELVKAKSTAERTGLMQNVALGLQVLIGALTTALGAALSGKNTSVAISILGGASTLITSYLARMKGLNEPQTSLLRAQALEHFLRDIDSFQLDHGHEFGDKWDHKIYAFRSGLERILGNQPGSNTINENNPDQEKGVGGANVATTNSGNGKYPVTRTYAKSAPMDV